MQNLIIDIAFQANIKASETIIRTLARFGIPDAQELIDRSHGKNNLQAHEKHLLRLAILFLRTKPSIGKMVRNNTYLNRPLSGRKPVWDRVANDFRQFARRHSGDVVSSTMRTNNPLTVEKICQTYLPDIWGGRHITGGAGAGTLKRAIKLLAHGLYG